MGLPATVRVTLGSVEVMGVGVWGPGQLQSSVASLRRLGRAGLEYSCLDQEWTFKYPFMPQLGHGPGGGLGFSHEQTQQPSLPHLNQGASFLCWLMEAWSHVKGGIWPNLIGPSLVLPVFPSY